MELHAFAKCKCINQSVIGNLNVRCDCGNSVSVGIVLYKSLKDIEHYFLGSCRHCVVGIKALIEVLCDADHDLVGLSSLRLNRGGFGGLLRCSRVCVLRCSFAAASEECTHHAYSKDPCQ